MKFFWEEENAALTAVEIVDTVIRRRRSIRAFLPLPVDAAVVGEILDVAAFAPSGGNMQPWHVHVLTGLALKRLVTAACYAFDHLPDERRSEYDYYPTEFFEPYAGRRRKLGWDLYGLLGIERGEKGKMRAQQRRNFEFFGAPVGMIFTIDRRLAQGSWVDYGMYLQNIMLAARALGLHTCPQAAWNMFQSIVLPHIGAGEGEMLVSSIALGYGDEGAVVNTCRTERESLASVVHWRE